METFIHVVAWSELILMGLAVLLAPLLIDRPRKPYSYGDYVRLLLGAGVMVPIFGRVLGWW